MSQDRVGRPVRVVTNSFEIRKLPVKPFYHYDVGQSFLYLNHLSYSSAVVITKKDPRGDRPCPRQRCTQIIEKLQDNHPNIFNPRASYDGYKNMFCSNKFNDGTYTVHVGARGVFEIKIVNVSTIHTADLMRFTTRDGASDPLVAQNTIPITLLQVILSQGPHLAHDFSLHAKSFYEERKSFELSGGIQGWRGFFQSVRPVLGRFIVNVNTTAAAFYTPGKLLDVACQVARVRDKRTLIHQIHTKQDVFEHVRRFYKGVIVTVSPSGVRKKITNIVRAAGRQTFEKDGAQITVEEYWAEHHNIVLQYPDAFGVQVGFSESIFPAEVCSILPGQRYKKKLSPEDTATFITQTKARPDQKLRDIKNAVAGQPLEYARSPWMVDAGMEVSTDPINADGRVLPPPKVHYGGGPMNVSDGAWNVMRQRLVLPARIDRWGMVIFSDDPSPSRVQELAQKAEEFLSLLVKNMTQLGIQFASPPAKRSGSTEDVWGSLSLLWRDTAPKDSAGSPILDANGEAPRPNFILVILPRDALDIRKKVKQWGDVKWAIPTQCVRGGKYDNPKGRDQYCNNVALKINAKVGGINNYAQPTPIATQMMQNAMFVGCDVSHPAPGVNNRPSVASLVASMDATATKYHVYVAVQMPRQEIITEIGRLLHNAVEDYRKMRKGLPQAIVIYRDGVSEGEYAKVEQEEIRQIEVMLKEAYNSAIQLVFIVVGKRHHNRLFPGDRSQGDRSGNCAAGLVIDSEIVHSKYIDFFLLSHSGLIGTSRPSHYVVLRNTPNVRAEQLQELSYTLCYIYAVATRSVSIPAPVYYADRVCARVSEFQFRPDLYEDDHSTDAGGDTPFPLQKWKEGLGLSIMSQRMYFL